MQKFLFNNTPSTLVFPDIGLEIEASGFFEVDQSLQQFYFAGCSIDVALDTEELLMATSSANTPPLEADRLSPFRAKYLLDKEASAFEIHYLDDKTELGASNLQEAMEKLYESAGGGVEEAPSDNKLYGRRNKEWLEVEVFGGAKPAGTEGAIQINTEGAFDSSPDFNYSKPENSLKVANLLIRPAGNKVGVWVL